MSEDVKIKKNHKVLKVLGIILAVLVVFFAVINIVPPKKNIETNPFVVKSGELPMIAAHRGGSSNNPENTMLAFEEAVKTIGVDIIESDLYLTKDGYLVYNHDSFIDETCNVNGDISLDEVKKLCEDESRRHYIEDMTLEELEQYNFGYYFENEKGERIYKDVTDMRKRDFVLPRQTSFSRCFTKPTPTLNLLLKLRMAATGELRLVKFYPKHLINTLTTKNKL